MKIIHTADLHIGSSFKELPEKARKIRKIELLKSFQSLVDYAKDNDIKVILLAGDIFDNDKVNKSDKEFFYDIISNNSDIDFLYLRGNHDIKSLINRNNISNLKLFGKDWEEYTYDNVVISGIELDDSNRTSLYNSLNLNKNKFNIVMIHGQVVSFISNPKYDIKIDKFKDKFIDYIALGHVHSYSQNTLDNRTTYAYPGCLQGRGFDETGEKGFIEIDTETKTYTFKKFAKREIYKVEIDISSTKSEYDAYTLVKEKLNSLRSGAIIQLIIKGKVDYDFSNLELRVKEEVKENFLYLEIRMNVIKKVEYQDYENDISLRGEVIREILKHDFDEETKNEILSNCLKLLDGEEIDL